MLFIGTTEPLAAAAVWSSDTDSYPGYPVQTNFQKRVQGTIFSDHSGSLSVEQSGDGVHWDVNTVIAVTASTGSPINVEVIAPWIRLVYTNGGSDQTVFRLFATLNDTGSGEPG